MSEKDPNDPSWQLYLEKSKRCEYPTCTERESKGKGWVKMVNPRTGKIVMYAWNKGLASMQRYMPICKACYNANKEAIDLASRSYKEPITSGQTKTYTQPKVYEQAPDAYLGPAPKWLAKHIISLCEKAEVRFDKPISPRELFSLLPEDFDLDKSSCVVPKSVETTLHVESTPHIPDPAKIPPKLGEAYERCPSCNWFGVRKSMLETNPLAMCDNCEGV